MRYLHLSLGTCQQEKQNPRGSSALQLRAPAFVTLGATPRSADPTSHLPPPQPPGAAVGRCAKRRSRRETFLRVSLPPSAAAELLTQPWHEGVEEEADDSHGERHVGDGCAQGALLLPDLHHHPAGGGSAPAGLPARRALAVFGQGIHGRSSARGALTGSRLPPSSLPLPPGPARGLERPSPVRAPAAASSNPGVRAARSERGSALGNGEGTAGGRELRSGGK